MVSTVVASGTFVVPIIDPEDLTYAKFCTQFFRPNKPCILRGAAKGWEAWTKWRHKDGSINKHYLMELFQESVSVPVVEMAGDMPYGVSTPRNMSFKDFVQNHLSVEPGSTLSSSSKYYLKDWHYAKEYATKLAYKTPAFFVDDWLNRWWDEGRKQGGDDSDFKFLYLGGAGTFTSLHHDVFRSNSWSASISGRKRWIIYHPLEEPNLKDSFEQFAPTGQWGGSKIIC